MVTLREERSRVLSLTSPVVPEATLVQSWATRADGVPSAGGSAARGRIAAPAAAASAGASGSGRPSLMTQAKVESVTLDATGESLPLQAMFSDERRIVWKKFELPATFTQSDSGPARDDVGLKLHMAKGAVSVRVVLDGGLPRQQRQGGDAAAPAHAPEAENWRHASDVAEALCDQHFDLVNDLYDHVSGDGDVFFDGPAGGVAAWPLGRVLAAWRQAALRDEPRPAFIVKLAETLPQLLAEVCQAPRKQLTRQRTYQPAGRVHEVDATCLRWLARQPGATVAEKAGAKQMAMAIERVEHADTLENRIVRELLRQAQAACQRYLAENVGDEDHVRVAIVDEFRRVLDRLWSQSPLRKLTPLSGIPHPNYVLQQDPRYRPLWKAYVMLLKQNLQRHQAWRWRHRMFSEAVMLAVLSALSTVAPAGAALKSSVLVRSELDLGRFIDPRTALGRWEIRLEPATPDALATTRRIHLVEQHQFNEYRSVCTSFPEQLCTLCPDFAVVCYDGDRPDKPARRMIAVWTMLDFDLDHDALESRCKAIDEGLRRIRTTTEIYGMLVQPKLRVASSRGVVDQVCVNRCAAYRMALPLQGQMGVFEQVMRAIVEAV